MNLRPGRLGRALEGVVALSVLREDDLAIVSEVVF